MSVEETVSYLSQRPFSEFSTYLFVRLIIRSFVAPASYAQTRIWLDEKIRFNPDKPLVAIYNMPFIYRLSPSYTLSVKQLHHALQVVVTKHQSLRTSLNFDAQSNQLMQRIIESNDNSSDNPLFTFIESIYETDEQLMTIMYDERRKLSTFRSSSRSRLSMSSCLSQTNLFRPSSL